MLFQHKLGSSPLIDNAVRTQLQKAILDDDPPSFRATLQAAHPDVASQHRLYGVLVMMPDGMGMRPVMVDETGLRIGGPDYVIPAGMPIDLLNVEYGESEMTVTIGDDIWKTPYKRG